MSDMSNAAHEITPESLYEAMGIASTEARAHYTNMGDARGDLFFNVYISDRSRPF